MAEIAAARVYDFDWSAAVRASPGNGIYGHANCVHIIEDEVLAARYLKYFDKLRTNPRTKQPDTSYKAVSYTHLTLPTNREV